MFLQLALTKEIVNECLKLHYGEGLNSKRLRQRLILIPLVLIAIATYLIYDELKKETTGQNFYMAILYIGFGISYYFFMRFRTLNGGSRLLKTLGSNASFTMEIYDDKLVTTTTNGSFDTKWDSFIRGLISDENVLLYQANDSFSMFNHSFFKAGDFEAFKILVRKNVAEMAEI